MSDLTRILGDNFYLAALRDELDEMTGTRKSRAKSVRAISGRLRRELLDNRKWPSDQAGRLALLLWLLDGRNAEILDIVRLRHRHEKNTVITDALKPQPKPLFRLNHDGLS